MAEAAPAKKKGCLKRGCLGCLGVVGLGLVVVMVLALIAVLRGTPDVVRESNRSSHPIPPHESIAAGTPVRVVLDVGMANFTIVPEPPGTPLRLDAHYDSGSYALTETFASEAELGWTYRLDFGRRSFLTFHLDPDNRLELHLPVGTPLAIEGDLGVGQFRLELGGLWIDTLDLETGVGDYEIEFGKPLEFPMRRFDVRGSIGELQIRGLGNASPAESSVRHRVGDLFLDLAGAWRQDAKVTVNQSVGGTRVGVPPVGVAFECSVPLAHRSEIQGLDERPEAPPGAPVVRLEASHSFGEFRLIE